MTVTDDRPGVTSLRSVRMYDDAWEKIGTRSKERSPFIRDMADAGLDVARCYRCLAPVPVEFRDLTGKPLAQWVEEAGKTVTRQHKTGHHPIVVGREAVPAPAPEVPRPAPGSAVFLEPGGSPVITAAVPDRKKGRKS